MTETTKILSPARGMATEATSRARKPHDVMARVVCELMLGGRFTVTALSKVIFGSARHRAGVDSAIEKLREHKVVRVHSYDFNGFSRYETQKIPGQLPDMPAPTWARPNMLGTAGRAPRRFMHKGKLMTAMQISESTGENIQAVRKRLRSGAARPSPEVQATHSTPP